MQRDEIIRIRVWDEHDVPIFKGRDKAKKLNKELKDYLKIKL